MRTAKLNSEELDGDIQLPSVKAKNSEKLKLMEKIDLEKYPPELIKLLVDGDYSDQLGKYKVKCYMLINEILEKKIPFTKFGVNTLLYKLCSSLKNQRSIEHFFNRRTQAKTVTFKETPKVLVEPPPVNKEESEESSDESSEDETITDESELNLFINQLLTLAQSSKRKALKLLDEKVDDRYELYTQLHRKIMSM